MTAYNLNQAQAYAQLQRQQAAANQLALNNQPNTSAALYLGNNVYVNGTTSTATNYITVASGGTGTATLTVTGSIPNITLQQARQAVRGGISFDADGKIKVIDECELLLPDGTIIKVDKQGNFLLEDKDAKITYRANRVRDFNSYINASDKLEAFIKFCGEEGVRQNELLQLPLHLFIKWLVIEAAKADQEPQPDVALLPDLRKAALPRCQCCGQFIPKIYPQRGIQFCSPRCFSMVLVKTKTEKNEALESKKMASKRTLLHSPQGRSLAYRV